MKPEAENSESGESPRMMQEKEDFGVSQDTETAKEQKTGGVDSALKRRTHARMLSWHYKISCFVVPPSLKPATGLSTYHHRGQNHPRWNSGKELAEGQDSWEWADLVAVLQNHKVKFKMLSPQRHYPHLDPIKEKDEEMGD